MSLNDKKATAALLSGQYDDGLTQRYDVASNGNYLQYNGLSRVGVRFDAGASALGTTIMSVTVRCRKYGTPTFIK